MSTVKHHTRVTATGRTTQVRRHSRAGQGAAPRKMAGRRPKRQPGRLARYGPVATGGGALAMGLIFGFPVVAIIGGITLALSLAAALAGRKKKRRSRGGFKPQVNFSATLFRCRKCGEKYANPLRHVCMTGFSQPTAKRAARRAPAKARTAAASPAAKAAPARPAACGECRAHRHGNCNAAGCKCNCRKLGAAFGDDRR